MGAPLTPDRWQRIEQLFHAAAERAPEERDAFLAAECAGDVALRHEVESLLGQRDGTLLQGGLAAAAALVAPAARGNHVGRALGPFVLGPLLGAGGMGDVYRAHDAKLGRDVAVKILPETLGQHSDRLARFEREARVLAALNHPHIAGIYGVEEGDGLAGLVLELVDGVTLADRLRAGPPVDGARPLGRAIPVGEALVLARQIADALHAAHRKGIVHRDLKPDNIKITSAGIVKVLDFGLAKFEGSESAGPAAVPVLATLEGVVLGTVAYMSPEQARGLAVDKRTDIWAFGCVLYEILTGARPFPGESSADVLGKITSGEPEWGLLPFDTPWRVHDLLRRCLAKDPERRLHDIADARIEIDDAIGDPSARRSTDPATLPVPARRPLVPWIVSGLMAAAAIAIWLRVPATSAPRSPVRLSIELPPDVSLWAIGRGSAVAVSPDGQGIVYAGVVGGRRQLYMRLVNGSDSIPISGTEGAVNPFFSPDGRWIGFMDSAPGGSLKKVPVGGGTALTLADNKGDGLNSFGVGSAWWGPDDTIVFAAINPKKQGLWRVPASGGSPVRLPITPQGEWNHAWPQVLQNGNALLYTFWKGPGFGGGRIAVQPLAGGERTILAEGGSYGRVVTRGDGRAWLVYARPEGLYAAPFDPDRLRVSGSAAPVLDGVLVNMSGGANFSVSGDGTLAYVPGGLDEVHKTAVWVARDGTPTEIGVVPGLGFEYRLSPDGRRLARPSATGATSDLYVDDLLGRGTATRLTFGSEVRSPVWTHDGRRIIYASGSPANLFWRPADGSGDEQRLTTSPHSHFPGSVSRDGTMLAYDETHPERGSDIWTLSLQEPRQPRLLVGTPAGDQSPVISPDGRWLAYHSNRSGHFEIYLASLVDERRHVPVSNGRGHNPLWSPEGRELYYRSRPPNSGDGHMMAVTIDTTGAIGTPRILFPTPYQGKGDISADGRFFLLKGTPQESPSRVIRLVLNWFEDLETKVPRQ